MSLYNPYRNYDKGMDDAYMGREPQRNSAQYNEGYNRCLQLEREEKQPDEKLCDFCAAPAVTVVNRCNLCAECAEAYDNKTGYCSLECCITGRCDESC
jgi:hypothetical protein